MKIKQDVPLEIQNLFLNEELEFIVDANNSISLKENLRNLIPGSLFIIFGSIFMVASIEDYFILGFVFLFLGAMISFTVIKNLFPQKRYYIGTKDRLIIFMNNKFNSFKWSEFEKNITISRGNDRGTIKISTKIGDGLEMMNDYEEYKKQNPLLKDYRRLFVFVPIEMVGVENAMNIGSIIEKKLVEANS